MGLQDPKWVSGAGFGLLSHHQCMRECGVRVVYQSTGRRALESDLCSLIVDESRRWLAAELQTARQQAKRGVSIGAFDANRRPGSDGVVRTPVERKCGGGAIGHVRLNLAVLGRIITLTAVAR